MSKRSTGIIIVDHGSKRARANEMLLQFVQQFTAQGEYRIVEPAHMELADPSIATAFDRCVRRGATQIIIAPYFLSPGRHWNQDIPRLAAKAAQQHTDVSYRITDPIGLHPLMVEIIGSRIANCLNKIHESRVESDESTLNS